MALTISIKRHTTCPSHMLICERSWKDTPASCCICCRPWPAMLQGHAFSISQCCMLLPFSVACADMGLCIVQCPNFNSLRVVSFSAAVMSLSYSTIAIGGAIAIGKQPDAYYNLDRFSTADKVCMSCSSCRSRCGFISFRPWIHCVSQSRHDDSEVLWGRACSYLY